MANNNMQTTSQKKTKGRQKIEIKPIKSQSNLQVTFSKRRSGLVKKASELSLLCGAQVAVIGFSPGNKAFAFGHPDVHAVLDRFLGENCNYNDWEATITASTSSDPQVQNWNKEYEDALKKLEEERKRKVAIEVGEKGSANGGFWWDDDEVVDHLGLEELEEYARALGELKSNVSVKVNNMQMMANHFGVEQHMDINGSGSGGGDFGGCVDWSNFGDGLF